MIEPDFLSISELASRWEIPERQVIEHGMHQRIPMMFLFSGLAISPSQSFLTGHGATTEEREAKRLADSIASSEAHIRQNAAGKCDEFSAMNGDEVLQLRRLIRKSEEELDRLNEALWQRDALRNKCEMFGYLRLPSPAIAELQRHGEILFPNRAFAVDGQLMWLEPGIERWKDRLSLGDLLIPMSAIKAIEESKKSDTQQPEPSKRPSVSATQDQAILDELRALGYDAENLPPYSPAGGARSEVKLSLLSKRKDLFTDSSFKHSWDRLKGAGKVVWTKGDK
jgi:hypothetical protein